MREGKLGYLSDVSVFQTHEVQNKILYSKWNIQLTQNKQWLTINIKSTICRNWAKSLKLYKIVRILVMFFNKYYRRDDWEHQSSLYTHSLPITTGSGQTNTTLLQFLSIIRQEVKVIGQKAPHGGGHSPVRGHPRGSKVVPLNSWGRVSY